MMSRTWSLRGHLSALLLVTMLLTFGVVGGAIMVWRVPESKRINLERLNDEIQDVSARLELLLEARRSRLGLLARLMHGWNADEARLLVENTVDRTSLFQAVYVVSPDGRVQAVALADGVDGREEDLQGSDLSANPLFRQVQAAGGVAWSGKYLSTITGAVAIGLGYRAPDGRVLIGEIPLALLLAALQTAAGQRASSIWVVDRRGEVIADTHDGAQVGRLNLLNWPVMQAMLHGQPPPDELRFEGRRLSVAAAHSAELDWYLIGTVPLGWHNPGVREVVRYVLGSFLACLLLGLLIAPFWASRMTRLLRSIVERAAQTRSGQHGDQAWPRGSVVELNRLSDALRAMAVALREREQKFLAIFNASPVPTTVADMDDGHRLLDANQAWCREYGRDRKEVLGRTAVEIGLMSEAQHDQLLHGLRGGKLSGEANLVRGDGQPVLAQVFAQVVKLSGGRLMLWATVELGPLRRVERQLRELNQQLESRVEWRTYALAESNQELSDTLEQLRSAQGELVRAEKMAALGALVAGVAHELNTPLGNGVLAVSALHDATRRFRSAMAAGLRRSDLTALIDTLEQGLDIAARNIHRAADLVQSFKQVAVDQTGSHRRNFELIEVVHEIVTSLKPSLQHTPYDIVVDVPDRGLRMDSYPGALGQALANLVQNAVQHGFDGRGHGTVRIDAARADDGRIELRVSDDGRGIEPELIAHVFEPFVTTAAGRGGTGLGLHVSHSAVVGLLGGTLTVRSTPGQGTCFELRLPAEAPHPPAGDPSGAEARQHGAGT